MILEANCVADNNISAFHDVRSSWCQFLLALLKFCPVIFGIQNQIQVGYVQKNIRYVNLSYLCIDYIESKPSMKHFKHLFRKLYLCLTADDELPLFDEPSTSSIYASA